MSNWKADSIKGRQSEDNARRVLKQLYNERYILSYRQTLRGSQDDRSGIDFYFSIKVKGRRIEIPLQVKSSKGGIRAHDKYYSMIHAVNGQSKDLREQIESIIIEYHNDLGGQDTVKPEVVNKPVVVEPIEEERKLELVPAVSQNEINAADVLFEIRDGKVWVSSLEIARLFEREHHNVLKAIKNLEIDPDFADVNFNASEYKDSTGRFLPMVMMTKKGYRRLVMDFTGKRASEVKEQLLDRFEELEEKESKPAIPALSGDFGALLIQAGQQIQEQSLVITTLKQKTQELEVVSTQLAMDNIAVSALLNDKDLIGLREAAKIFKLFGDDTKALTVIRAMTELGWIYKMGKDSPNLPKSTLEAKGYFKTVMPKCNGEEREQAKFTPKGMQWAYPKMCAHFGRPLDPIVQQYIQALIDKQQYGDTPPAA